MNRRLSVRLALCFVGIAVLSIVLAGLISNYVVNRKFDEYVAANEEARNAQIAQALADAYSTEGGWTPGLVQRIPRWATMLGVRIRISTRDGSEVIDTGSMRSMMTPEAADEPPDEGLTNTLPIVTAKQRFVGTVQIGRLQPDTTLFEQDVLFRQSTNTALLVSGIVAALLALVLSVFVSQRLVRPIRAVTAAAQAMEGGSLSQRVETTGNDEVAELGNAFNQMADALTHQEQLRKNLTADVAHELRTPLSTIQSQIEAIQDGVMEPTPERLESIHEEIVRLARLVGDLRQLSEAEGGTLTLATKPVDLNTLVAEIVTGLEPRFSEEGVALDIDLADQPQTALLDRDKMRQVIVNLTSNALKYSQRGGWVRLSTATAGDSCTITVADNGAGIDEEHLPHIFERFFRAEKSRSRATGGAGIGLAITKQLVNAHGGQITVSSEFGRGTTFVIKLPRVQGA